MTESVATLMPPTPTSGHGSGDKPVRVEGALAERMKAIADHLDVTISEYLSPLIRDRVNEDYEKVLRDQLARLEAERKKKKEKNQ